MKSMAYLLEVYADGSITEEEAAELVVLLESEPEELQKAKETLEIHGMVQEHSRFDSEGDELVKAVSRSIDFSQSPDNFEKSILVKTERLSRQRKLIMYLPLAASIFIVAGMWMWNKKTVDQSTSASVEKSEIFLARIIAQDMAVWRKDRDGTPVGQTLARGSYKLTKGTAVLETEVGTVISLKAPVEFELLNSERLLLNSGEAGVRVAKGSTYNVDTAAMLIVDLGTEFTVKCAPDKTSLFVFKGEVGVFSTSSSDESKVDSIRLKEGEGLEYESERGYYRTKSNQSDLQRATDIRNQFSEKEYFVIDLAGKNPQKLNKLVLYNYGQEEQGHRYYSKDFTVQVTADSSRRKNFKTILEGTLEPRTGPQTFEIPLTEARFIKLIINTGYQEGFLELSEFAAFNMEGRNVTSAPGGGKLFDFHSDYPFEIKKGYWVAANIIDGKTTGHASDSWASNGKALFDEFLTVKLSQNKNHIIDRLIIYNYGQEEGGYNYYSKDFTVQISNTTDDDKSYKTVLKDTLKAKTGAQQFSIPQIEAKYIRLIINSGYRTGFVQVGEFEAYSKENVNVAASKNDGHVIDFSSQDSRKIKQGFWRAENLIDGKISGPEGSWCSEKLLPSKKNP